MLLTVRGGCRTIRRRVGRVAVHERDVVRTAGDTEAELASIEFAT